MKGFAIVALLAGVSLSFAEAGNPSPVSRVVALLEDLAEKIDSELKAETDLYETYVCWAQTVITSKKASNEAAQSRIDSLKTYLADLDAGRIELTTERSDLEKEINELMSNLETAKALREKENSDYKAAVKEIDQALAALDEAIKVLDEATKDSKSASMVSLRASINQKASEGFSTRVAEADALQRAVDVGSRYLKAGDALFLKRLLSGEVPQKDWKKLNRKAEFKMKYKARSVKIQDTLAKLKDNFKTAKEDADKKEEASKKTYDTLKESKEAQLTTSQDSLNKQEVEGGAAGVSKEDAKAEIESLETQVTDDKKHITDTEDALKKKKEEFKTRKGLRVGEMAAISKAVSVIHSDDARDTFKRSISFLQIEDVTATATARAGAAIRNAAHASGDSRLSALAARVAMVSGAKFTKVISAIDKMIAKLEGEGKDDDDNKKDCEKNREDDTKEAADLSRKMDDLTDAVTKLENEIEEIVKEIEEKLISVKETKKEIKDAKRIRTDENTEWVKNDADDTEAIKLLEQSSEVLKTFYKENFSLMQKKMDPVVAGEAPPPPPATWEGDYGGQKKESNGIIAILELIKTDVEKDQKDAKTAEDESQTAHDKFVKESEASIEKLQGEVDVLKKSKADKEGDIKDKKDEHKTKDGTLKVVVKRMKEAAPGCDFLLVNFKVRSDNRQMEIDGLNQAKEILDKQNK